MTDKEIIWRDNYNRPNHDDEIRGEGYKNTEYQSAIEDLQKKHSRLVKISAVVFIIFGILLGEQDRARVHRKVWLGPARPPPPALTDEPCCCYPACRRRFFSPKMTTWDLTSPVAINQLAAGAFL